jgi:hypothetical protein
LDDTPHLHAAQVHVTTSCERLSTEHRRRDKWLALRGHGCLHCVTVVGRVKQHHGAINPI